MHLESLTLVNFRNYVSQQLKLSAHLNAFTGLNGMGKTNILDAIYYLCMCKSHFGVNEIDLVRREESFFRLVGDFRLEDKKERVIAKVIPRKQKVFERNDKAYRRLMDHIGLLPVVMIVPDDTRLATDGSEERRRLLDNTLSQTSRNYLENLVQYNRVIKQRNSLLKGQHSRGLDENLMQAFDEQLFEPAATIYNHRREFVRSFSPVFETYYQRISGKAETVRIEYVSPLEQHSMQTLLLQSAEKDRLLQRTTTGIHKDNLKFIIDDRPLKRFASQGQLKSFVLALKLAQYEYLRTEKSISPILLLDDIFDKLDRQRVRQLIGLLLEQNFGQVFITDTHESRLVDILSAHATNFRNFRVQEGVAEVNNTHQSS